MQQLGTPKVGFEQRFVEGDRLNLKKDNVGPLLKFGGLSEKIPNSNFFSNGFHLFLGVQLQLALRILTPHGKRSVSVNQNRPQNLTPQT